MRRLRLFVTVYLVCRRIPMSRRRAWATAEALMPSTIDNLSGDSYLGDSY